MRTNVIVSLIAMGALLLILDMSGALRGTAAPRVPRDIFHDSVIADAGCRTCHTPGRQAPLKKEHAPVTECMTCHVPRNRG